MRIYKKITILMLIIGLILASVISFLSKTNNHDPFNSPPCPGDIINSSIPKKETGLLTVMLGWLPNITELELYFLDPEQCKKIKNDEHECYPNKDPDYYIEEPIWPWKWTMIFKRLMT